VVNQHVIAPVGVLLGGLHQFEAGEQVLCDLETLDVCNGSAKRECFYVWFPLERGFSGRPVGLTGRAILAEIAFGVERVCDHLVLRVYS